MLKGEDISNWKMALLPEATYEGIRKPHDRIRQRIHTGLVKLKASNSPPEIVGQA